MAMCMRARKKIIYDCVFGSAAIPIVHMAFPLGWLKRPAGSAEKELNTHSYWLLPSSHTIVIAIPIPVLIPKKSISWHCFSL